METSKTYLFEQMPVPRAIGKLAIPTILSSLVMILYNLADTYFVALLNDPVQNAAVTLAAPVMLAFNAVTNLFGIGSAATMSRFLGAKNYDGVRKSAAFGLYCTIISGLLFSAAFLLFREPLLHLLGSKPETEWTTAQYLFWTTGLGATPSMLNIVLSNQVRAEGAAVYASIGTMSGCFLNILLDPLFIMPWGLNMGASGAGLATLISNCLACLVFFVYMWRQRANSHISLHPRWFRPDRSILKNVLGVGIPASIQNLLNVTGMTILNNFTAEFGSSAIAAMGIAQKINVIPFYVALGLSQGTMPLVGYNYASGDHPRMRHAVRFAMGLSLVFLTAFSLFDYLAAPWLVSLFMSDPAIIHYGASFLRGLCLALPFIAADFISVGIFQACGLGTYALVFAILRKIVFEIPFLFIFNYLFPLYGLAYAQFGAEFILAILALIMLRRFFHRLQRQQAD